jgi:hypothetical protein
LGTAIFCWFEFTRDPEPASPRDEIVVTKGHVERLAALFAKTWQRPPTAKEREGLIEDFIREEVYYREALAAGFDKNDTIVRRRMRQKLEFVTEDIAEQIEPTEEELREYLGAHAPAFRKEPRFWFRHVYFNTDRRKTPEKDARATLAQLKAGGLGTDAGDSLLMVEPAFADQPLREIARALGQVFVAELLALPVGEWSGPVQSGFGPHLVFVEKRTEGRVAKLEEVREAVARDWRAAKRREMREAFYQELRKRYVITVEKD